MMAVDDQGVIKNFQQMVLDLRALSLSAWLVYSTLSVQAQDRGMTSVGQTVPVTQAAIEIHRAASDGNVEKVSELLKSDPSLLESRDEIGMTPLLVAARDGKVNVVTFLIEKGADIKATTKMGNYDALSLAAKNGQKDVVLILLDKGADANRTNSDGDTPITLAQNEGHAEILALFKARGYTVNPILDWVITETPLARRESSWMIDSFKVSPDNKRIVCAARLGDKCWVVVDGKNGKSYDGISQGSPIFSPDSKQVAYVAWVGDKRLVVVDGKEGALYDDISDLVFSPDSMRVAYVAKTGRKSFAVVDGKEGHPEDKASHLIFSPNSKRVAYLVQTDNVGRAVAHANTMLE